MTKLYTVYSRSLTPLPPDKFKEGMKLMAKPPTQKLVFDTAEVERQLDVLEARIDRIMARIDALDERLRPKVTTLEVGEGYIGHPDTLTMEIRKRMDAAEAKGRADVLDAAEPITKKTEDNDDC